MLPAYEQRREPLGEFEIVVGVTLTISIRSAMLGQPFHPVLTDRLEQMVAGHSVTGFHDDERLIDQGCDAVEDVFSLERIAHTDRFGCLEREASGEHREPAEERLLPTVEEPVAPVHGAAERSLAR